VSAWTGNDARVLEFGESEARPLIGRDPTLISIRDEGIHLAGDDRFLRRQRVQG
jgi:hypothetical protein